MTVAYIKRNLCSSCVYLLPLMTISVSRYAADDDPFRLLWYEATSPPWLVERSHLTPSQLLFRPVAACEIYAAISAVLQLA